MCEASAKRLMLLGIVLAAVPGSGAQTALLTAAYETQLETWLGQGNLSFKPLFTKTQGDANSSFQFHNAVDNKGPTVTLLKAYGTTALPSVVNSQLPEQIIGGYNPQSWHSKPTPPDPVAHYLDGWNMTYTNAERNAFLFNLTSNTLQTQTLDTEAGARQTFNSILRGPTFGSGHDLSVDLSLEEGYAFSHSFGGTTFGSPITFGGQDPFGSHDTFRIAALEVYGVGPAPIDYSSGNVFGISIGQNDGQYVSGDKGADRVLDRLKTLSGSSWATEAKGNTTSPITIDAAGFVTDGSNRDLNSAVLNSLTSMNPDAGDTFVFFYDGHGFGGDTKFQFPGALTGDSLGSALSDSKWDDVRKIFFVDSCHSGGLLDSLHGVTNFALFAAATADGDSYPIPESYEDAGMGIWTKHLLLPSLEDVDLRVIQLKNDIGTGVHYFEALGLDTLGITVPLNAEPGAVGEFRGITPFFYASSDFDQSLGLLPVATPDSASTVLLAGFTVAALVIMRRRSAY